MRSTRIAVKIHKIISQSWIILHKNAQKQYKLPDKIFKPPHTWNKQGCKKI